MVRYHGTHLNPTVDVLTRQEIESVIIKLGTWYVVPMKPWEVFGWNLVLVCCWYNAFIVWAPRLEWRGAPSYSVRLAQPFGRLLGSRSAPGVAQPRSVQWVASLRESFPDLCA